LLWCAPVAPRLRLKLNFMFRGLPVFLATVVASAPCKAAPLPAASVEPPELRLTWDAPDTCPSAAEVEAQFDRLLGGRGRVPSAKRVEATATVRRALGGTWNLRLDTTVDDATGHRDLEGDSCWAVAAATALVLALTIDPNAAARASLTPPAAASPVPSAPAAPAPSATPPAGPLETKSTRPFLRAFGGVAVAILPEPGPIFGLGAGIRRGWIDVELSGLGSLETRAYATDRPGAGGYFRLLAFGARGCGRATAIGSPVAVRLCAGGEIERMIARGFGVELPGSGGATLVAGLGAAVASLRIASWAEIALELSGSVRPYHPTFVLTGVGEVFTVPAASAVGALGLNLTL
jgi:hypothetical protein